MATDLIARGLAQKAKLAVDTLTEQVNGIVVLTQAEYDVLDPTLVESNNILYLITT